MASRIPEYQRRVAPEVTQAARVRPQSVDASGLAQGLNQAAGAVYQVQRQEEAEANRTALIEADNNLGSWSNKTLFDPENGAFTKQGKAALGVSQSVLTQFDQQQQAIHDSLSNDEQRLQFKQASAQRRAGLEQQLSGYEFKQQQQYKDDVDKSSIQLSLDSGALSYNDPQAIAQNRLKGAAVIESRAERLGWSPEEREAQLQQFNSQLSHSVIQRTVIDSPQKAKAQYEEFKGSMTADDQIRATSTIDQAFKRQEAEARQRQVEARQMQALARMELRTRIEDANAGAMNGFTPTDVPSFADFKRSYEHPEQAKAAYNSFQKVQAVAPVAQELKNAPVEQWPQLLQQFDKSRNGTAGPGFAEDQEIQQHVQRLASNILKQRQDDPAAYVIKNNPGIQQSFAAAAQTGDWGDYVTKAVAEQRRLGIQQPQILPSAQAEAISTKLKNGDPTVQSEMLTNLSNQFGANFKDVVKQVGSDAPVQAMAGMIGSANKEIETQRSGVFSKGLSRSPQFIQDTLLNGDNALKTKAYKLPPSTNANGQIISGPDKAFYDAVNGIMDPNSVKQLKASYDAYYAGLAIQKGKYGEGYDSSISSEAIKAIGIEPVEIGTGKTIAPYGMDKNEFKDHVTRKYDEYQKSNPAAPGLGDLTVYPVGNDTYLLRDPLGKRVTTIKVGE